MATASPPPAPSVAEREGLYEVVDGRIVEKPPMGAFEVELASLLARWMGEVAEDRALGRVVTEMLFLIHAERPLKRRPDVAFVSAGRWPLERRAPRTEAWEVVPDLAVEIVSPSNLANDVADKLEEYFRAGVQGVWVVYPSTCKVYLYDGPASVRILQLGDELDGGELVPGFRLQLSRLFGEGEPQV